MADGTDVFAALSSLVKRFGSSSQGLPAQQEIIETEKLIRFSCHAAGQSCEKFWLQH